MGYVPDTILKRKTPFEAPKNPEEEIDLTPYNEVRVIGPSPVVKVGERDKEWEGEAGNEFSIQPTSFGTVVDRPFGELQRDYEVVSVPEKPEVTGNIKVREETLSPPPEQVFAQAVAKANSA